MARRQTKTTEIKAVEQVAWVNRTLTEDEMEWCDAQNVTFEDLMVALGTLVAEGYQFSAKWDTYSSAFQTTLVCKAAGSVNFGKGLSARSSDISDAMYVLYYKHALVLRGDWGTPVPVNRAKRG